MDTIDMAVPASTTRNPADLPITDIRMALAETVEGRQRQL
jgi:hypothetical protein